jgi:sulfite exporter TauE/SafE
MDNYNDVILNTPQKNKQNNNSKIGRVLFSIFSFFLSFFFIWGLFNEIVKWLILIFCMGYFILQILNHKKENNLFKEGSNFYKIWFIAILLLCIGGLFNEMIARTFITYMAIGTIVGAITIHIKDNKKVSEVLGVIILIISIVIIYILDR